MKKNNLNKVFTGLLVCMLAVTAFVLKGCKDEEKDYFIDYPKDGDIINYIISDVKGKLAYSEEEKRWVIHPNMDDSPFPSGDEMGSMLFVLNMKEEYKELEGEIYFSGRATYIYRRVHGMGGTNIFLIELTHISRRTDSRAIIDEDFKCATQAPTPPAWLFSRSTTNDDNNKYYNFRVFVHVVRNSAGTFPTDTDIIYLL